jgi:hypothetical protein
MPSLNALIKKRARLEAQILEAQRLEKRRVEVVALLEKHGLLTMSDAQILSALQPKATPPSFTNQGNTGDTP